METKAGTTDEWQTGSSHVHDWDADYNCTPQDNISSGGDLHCDRGFVKVTPHDYSDDFHTYTCVWSDSKITFFVDGKETWSETELLTHPQALRILIGFSTFDVSNQVSSYDFVVDYVRVYKPVSNPTYQCLQNIQSPSAKTLDATETPLLVHNTWSTQTTTTNIALSRMRTQDIGSSIKVYYRGTDGRCYNSYQSAGSWYEYPLMWTVTDVGDDVTPFNDRVYYRAVVNGVENGLKYFKWNTTLGKWENFSTGVNNCGGFLNIDQYGRVSYKGYNDNNLYVWDPESNTTSQITTDGSVEGGLIMDECGCLAFYREKNTNNLRQWYWWDDVWHDVGAVASNGKVTNHTVYDADNSIVYFIGSDKKVYEYTATYSSATSGGLKSLYNMIGDDNAASDLVISPDNNLLYYIGDEGKIWYYHNDLEDGSKLTGRWYRSCLNYFAYSAQNSISALCVDDYTGRLFFRGNYGGAPERVLFTTNWRDADNICACAEPPESIHLVYKTDGNETTEENKATEESKTTGSRNNIDTNNDTFNLQVLPNPSVNKFVFFITGTDGYSELTIEDINGKRVYEQKTNSSDARRMQAIWDASSVNAGIYFYRLKAGEKIVTGKLVKI